MRQLTDLRSRWLSPLAALLLASGLAPGFVDAATIYVDGTNQSGIEDGSQSNPFNNIQQALNNASSGDLIQVGPGTYHETIVMRDGVKLFGAGPDVTIIDATGRSNSVVTFNETRDSPRLSGFTITGGSGERVNTINGVPVTVGGGIFIINSSPTITGNVITGNVVDQGIVRGGGIYANLTLNTPTISGNVISDNVALSATKPDDGDGGGIFILSKIAGSVVSENIIERNIAFRGGGLFVDNTGSSNAVIQRNTLQDNQAAEGAAAFTREASNSSSTIINNLAVGNGSDMGTKDCDDSESLSGPGLAEVCADGIDNDCNPATADIFDHDGDGIACDVDCNDEDPLIGPQAAEQCTDEIDNDCDGDIDLRNPDNRTVIAESTATRYLANTTSPGIALAWIDPAFDDSGWADGTFGIGYETEPPGADDLITTTVPTSTASIYTRTTFNVADLASVNGVFVAADYDDGWIAWVNGTEVYRSPEMPAGAPAWNSGPTPHESSNATDPVYGTPIDVTSTALPLLLEGDNVVAIAVYTELPGSSPDLVIVPRVSLAVGADDSDCLCPDADGDGYACNDCDDTAAGVNPGSVEICNDGIDNDCNPATPDVFDADSDGFNCAIDCDPSDPLVNPAATEIDCDGIDNDCNPGTPDVVDRDGDFYDCTVDCNDAAPSINPGVVEFCFDGMDNNCDGAIDSADFECQCAQPVDLDGDGYRCTDCNDGDANINPGANEICDDGIDNDCTIATPDIFDADGDGFACDLDCQDLDPAVNPDASEKCDDGIDNDCDGLTDAADVDDCSCADNDGDGYACTDCDDGNPQTNPGSVELCNDGVDNDCNPATADVSDVDGDGFDCTSDCNDSDPDIRPSAPEQCGDFLDNDCDGLYDVHQADLTLLTFGSSMRYLANLDDPGIGLGWIDQMFNDQPWENGVYGVGYQLGPPGTGADALIVTDVPPGTASVYTRARFTIPDPAGVNALFIGADYDDAWVAWINGVEVYRSPEMPAGPPTWDANPELHESSNGQTPDYGTMVDISAPALGALEPGINVIAIGLYNNIPSGTYSSDLVVVPRLAMDFGNDDPDCGCEDLDGDGYAGGACATDCNDAFPSINPGAPEIGCDGIDNDCNPATVDVFDADGDGFACDVDCLDQLASVYPGAPEIHCDFTDNDCNSSTPDVVDMDMDGFNCFSDCDDSDAAVNPLEVEIGCDDIDNDCSTLTSDFVDADGDGFTCEVDCDESDPLINPAGKEKCDDGKDNDCNGLIDMADTDKCSCTDPDADGYRCDDCAPGNAAINPAAAEICNDGLDNDCNPATEDLGDLDGDGIACLDDCDDTNPFVRPNMIEICNDGVDNDCNPATVDLFDLDGDGVTCDLDCDEFESTTNPGAPELCNDGVDNDCNPATPDIFDGDGDGFECLFDCDDTVAAVNPDATEVCNDGIDNDCNPSTVDLFDGDGDGATCDVDCADDDATRYPGAPEKCDDGIDNDCDGLTDMADTGDCSCPDPDADGWRCDDCLPNNAAANPGATEICNDGLDNDCNPATPDLGDGDGDGYVCTADCDDADPSINPGMAEVCNDGIDNDCNAGTLDLFDNDADTYACDVDCNDDDATVHPGAEEIGCDGIDNDCDGMTTDIRDSDGDSFSCADTRVRGGAFSSLVLSSSGRVAIVNNTIVGNHLGLGSGGGLYVNDMASGQLNVVANNIVFGNSAFVGGGFDRSLFFGEIRSNDVFGNVPSDVYNGAGSMATLVGNLAVDPGFSSAATGNFRLAPDSPLIDAADPDGAPNVDLDRFGRPYDGDGDTLAVVDIGAYEYPSGEVFHVQFVDRDSLSWDVGFGGQRFNVYRGNLGILRAVGGDAYTQNPSLAVPERYCSVDGDSLPFVDGYLPASPTPGVFYLVTTTSASYEGSLGADSAGVLRSNSWPCP